MVGEEDSEADSDDTDVHSVGNRPAESNDSPSNDRDPIEVAGGDAFDLYDVATWEPRSRLDRFAVGLHRWFLTRGPSTLVFIALVIVIGQFALVGVSIYEEPVVGLYVFLSIVPALGIAVYVWRADVTRREPLGTMVVTFLFGFLFAGFAAIVNRIGQDVFTVVPWIGLLLFFFLVVAPIEEFVKLLAVRLFAYRTDTFDSVIDGAVYGAIAGLGFATIENSIYIVQRYLETQQMGSPEAGAGAVIGVAALRTFAGPGHVLYAALSGYYLGLAKFNPEQRGPIVVKGLVIAAVLHAVYNSIVSHLEFLLSITGVPLGFGAAFIGFVLIYDGAIAYWLSRKLRRYQHAFEETGAAAVVAERASRDDGSTPEAPTDDNGSESAGGQ